MRAETKRQEVWREHIWPLVVLISVTALYFFSFYNRFAGLRSGDGEFGGGIAWLSGMRPYRDYFTAGPPLNVFKSALELGLFGKLLIVSRTFAVFERLLIASTLYLWLKSLFSARASLIAALVTIVVSAGDRTDPLASYNHDALFLAMLCGFAAHCALEAVSMERQLWLACVSGTCGALSLLTKQTVGALVVAAVLASAGFAMWRMHGRSQTAKFILAFVTGVVIPVLALVLYLLRLGALHACLDMLFVRGPHAKAAHPFVFLARDVMIAGLYRWWLMLAMLLLALAYRSVVGGFAEKYPCERLSLRYGALFAVGALTVIAAGFLLHLAHPLQDTGKAAVYFALAGAVIGFLYALQHAIGAKDGARLRSFQLMLACAVSLATAVSLSLSFPAFEAMVLPGLGVVIAAIYDGSGLAGKSVTTLLCGTLLLLQACEKAGTPFGFDHQEEPAVRYATIVPTAPMLRGMRMPQSTVDLLNGVQKTVAKRVGANETIFTYPEMGLLYSLTGHYPPTKTASHNIDVVEDSFAREEAVRLLRSPPSVIIYAKPSDEDLRISELVWREGRPSGQRAIIAAVDQIVSQYELTGTYQLLPQDTPIRVYARPVTK